jgi:hypothetical protein
MEKLILRGVTLTPLEMQNIIGGKPKPSGICARTLSKKIVTSSDGTITTTSVELWITKETVIKYLQGVGDRAISIFYITYGILELIWGSIESGSVSIYEGFSKLIDSMDDAYLSKEGTKVTHKVIVYPNGKTVETWDY